ncbi:unnamed protein product [Adineta steineri]|uniref:Uncharacterized protein n=1 Tax=Adineta steineri TaxID=433720 RepID=A0A818UUV4_9BILA|nr:unnamed protein product [Adineta steineri]CAF3703670.1 unnamed protein product [Adineta steineri]
MNLITILIYIILLCGSNVELSLFKTNFHFYVQNVASIFHSNWRENFLKKNPFVKNRFKLTKSLTHYNSSDFLYPMILTVGSCLVHRNFKVAQNRYNSSLIYVDILNMNYNELPPDWALENRATAQIACKYVIQGLRKKKLFNQNFIEKVSTIIHNEWMKRNGEYASKDLMVPFMNLTETEKDKDRKAILIACRIYNELYLYHKFNTTPVAFVGYINQLN